MKKQTSVMAFGLLLGALVSVTCQAQVLYNFRNPDGTEFQGTMYYPTACTNGHTTPDRQSYEHCHPTNDFPIVDARATNGMVTAAMSDAYWTNSLRYPIGPNDYGFVSGSTFQWNCYAYATGAPYPMSPTAWIAWTDVGTLGDGVTRPKSYSPGGDHAIKLGGIYQVPEGSVIATNTVEKNASGPIVSKNWSGGVSLGQSTIRNVKANP